jgi:hypothetical protein
MCGQNHMITEVPLAGDGKADPKSPIPPSGPSA